MGARPVLGVICCQRTVGSEPAQAVMERYVRAAMRYADVAALLIPSLPDLMSAAEVAPRLDGVLLTGTPSNVAPHRYGRAHGDGPFDEGRDAIALAMVSDWCTPAPAIIHPTKASAAKLWHADFKSVANPDKNHRFVIPLLQRCFFDHHRRINRGHGDICFDMHTRAPMAVIIGNHAAGTGDMAAGHLWGYVADAALC